MGNETSIYDDPAFLEMVKAEFEGRYRHAHLRLSQPAHPDYRAAANLLKGFMDGVEFAVVENIKVEGF